MGAAIIRTIRPCLGGEEECGHGASAHKWRKYEGARYRAECEFCDCQRYVDPMITLAEIHRGPSDTVKRSGVNVPAPVPRWVNQIRSIEEQRAYWRRKQEESRERRRLQ